MCHPYLCVLLTVILLLAGGCSLFDNDSNGIPAGVDQSLSMDEDGILEIEFQGILATEDELEQYDIEITEPPAHGFITRGYPVDDDANKVFLYYPENDYHGHDAFSFAFTREGESGTEGTVDIAVQSVNDPPYIRSKFATGTTGTAFTFAITAGDPDGDQLTWSITNPPDHGTVTVDQNGQSTYHSADDFTGFDVFGVTVADSSGDETYGAVLVHLFDELLSPIGDGTVLLDTRGEPTTADTRHLDITSDASAAWFSANAYNIETDLSQYGMAAYQVHLDGETTTPTGLSRRDDAGALQDYCQGLSCSSDGTVCAYIGATISTGVSHLYLFEIDDREQTLIDLRDKMPSIAESTYFSSIDISGSGDHLAFSTIGDGIDNGSHAWHYNRTTETLTRLPATIDIDGNLIEIDHIDKCAIADAGNRVAFTASYSSPVDYFWIDAVFTCDVSSSSLTSVWPAPQPPHGIPENWYVPGDTSLRIGANGEDIAFIMQEVDEWGYYGNRYLVHYDVLSTDHLHVSYNDIPGYFDADLVDVCISEDATKVATLSEFSNYYFSPQLTNGRGCSAPLRQSIIVISDSATNTQTGLATTDVQAIALTPDGRHLVTASESVPTTFHRYDLTSAPTGAN